MIKNLMSILILTLCLSHCTKMDFDGFNPATSALKWIITNDDERGH